MYGKYGGLHYTIMPCEPNTANRQIEAIFVAKFVPELTTLCMLGLKLLELFRAFYERFKGFRTLRIMGIAPVAVFLGRVEEPSW